MSTESYNGWTNWETWNLNLWVSNEEWSYTHIRRQQPFDACTVETAARDIYPDGTPDMSPEDMQNVDWDEIAKAWNDF